MPCRSPFLTKTKLYELKKLAFKAINQGQSLINSRASPITDFSRRIELSRGSGSLDIPVLVEVGHSGG